MPCFVYPNLFHSFNQIEISLSLWHMTLIRFALLEEFFIIITSCPIILEYKCLVVDIILPQMWIYIFWTHFAGVTGAR